MLEKHHDSFLDSLIYCPVWYVIRLLPITETLVMEFHKTALMHAVHCVECSNARMDGDDIQFVIPAAHSISWSTIVLTLLK